MNHAERDEPCSKAKLEESLPWPVIADSSEADDKMGHAFSDQCREAVIPPSYFNAEELLPPTRGIIVQHGIRNRFAAGEQRINHDRRVPSTAKNDTSHHLAHNEQRFTRQIQQLVVRSEGNVW